MNDQENVITVELVDGTKIVVPNSLELITPYVLLEQQDWFEDEIRFLRKLVQPGNTVVDIGANFGVYALSLARKVGARGAVWAFEPATSTARLLRESAKVNNSPWLYVVQQALSNREGVAWLQMPGHPELNSLVDAKKDGEAVLKGQGEQVKITTLDCCQVAYGWKTVDVLKIDAEGEEESILKGGQCFFHEFSPLVMFEVRQGADMNLHLVEQFEKLGYQCFRLIPSLDALIPFKPAQILDDYLLNLFAAKPDRVKSLAESGLLIDTNLAVSQGCESSDRHNSLSCLAAMPYAQPLAACWQDAAQQTHQFPIRRALDAWFLSQNSHAQVVERYRALELSLALLQQASPSGCSPGRLASLARVALASGERAQAVQALNSLVQTLHNGLKIDIYEPFLSPDPTFELLPPRGHLETWLEAAALAALEQAGSFSGFYSGFSSLPRLKRLKALGYAHGPIQRRIQLFEQRFASQDAHENAMDSVHSWFDFIGLQEPLLCLDVGALALNTDVEPWVHWAQQGCAEVVGFEPLASECNQLNQKAKGYGGSVRYLPLALGDGELHTLHVTNAPMNSSLYPPARNTVDLFSALGELMQVEKQVPVQTCCLDEIAEARRADFIKLDVQGAELMILENAQEVLKSVSVIQCEVEFVELYEGQPLMADIDIFLRSKGFCFLRFAYTMGRPLKPLHQDKNPCNEFGQMLWGGAIYIRDFRALGSWTSRQLRAAAFILHELYGSYDLVARILRELDLREEHNLSGCYLASLMLAKPGLCVST